MKTSLIEVGPIENARELEDGGGGFVEVIDPATAQPFARQACCDERAVHRIVERTREAYESPQWQSLSPSARGRLLLKLADLVEENAPELIELELLDTGKPITQLRDAEIPLTAEIIRFYAGAADKIEGSVKSLSGGSLNLTFYEPYGVVAGILPWNYPLVNAAMKTAPALAAGNAIVLKPSVETPVSTVAFARLCAKAGIPAGIVSVVLGSGSRIGDCLTTDPRIGKISFTGSTKVGQAIQRLATDQMKAVNLELGGKNAIVVFADADLERACDAVLFSGYVNAGQLCVSCSRLLVEESVADQFESLLLERMLQVRVGDPRNVATQVGPMITESQYKTALQYISGALEGQARLRCGGGKANLPAPNENGYFLQPTLISHMSADMKVAQEEIFGPCLSVIRFRDEDEALHSANAVQYGLSGSVWTSDGSRALRLVRRLDTGIVWVNTMLTGYPQIPVPPHKMSGTGVELGMEGLLAYCKRKSAVIGYDSAAVIGWNLGRRRGGA
jgi:acyl-CoA reductase-like NAD-dependent aldehyde dehydrogenase